MGTSSRRATGGGASEDLGAATGGKIATCVAAQYKADEARKNTEVGHCQVWGDRGLLRMRSFGKEHAQQGTQRGLPKQNRSSFGTRGWHGQREIAESRKEEAVT